MNLTGTSKLVPVVAPTIRTVVSIMRNFWLAVLELRHVVSFDPNFVNKKSLEFNSSEALIVNLKLVPLGPAIGLITLSFVALLIMLLPAPKEKL